MSYNGTLSKSLYILALSFIELNWNGKFGNQYKIVLKKHKTQWKNFPYNKMKSKNAENCHKNSFLLTFDKNGGILIVIQFLVGKI